METSFSPRGMRGPKKSGQQLDLVATSRLCKAGNFLRRSKPIKKQCHSKEAGCGREGATAYDSLSHARQPLSKKNSYCFNILIIIRYRLACRKAKAPERTRTRNATSSRTGLRFQLAKHMGKEAGRNAVCTGSDGRTPKKKKVLKKLQLQQTGEGRGVFCMEKEGLGHKFHKFQR